MSAGPAQRSPQGAASGRLTRLEALRGLGALAVLLTHCFLAVPWQGEGAQSAMIRAGQVLANGHAALVVFFVISGYVLGLSLDRGADDPRNFSNFLLRRVLRIYPAHVVSLVAIAIALTSFDHHTAPPQSSALYAGMFPADFHPLDWLLNLPLLATNMNGVTWSLAVEMGVSLAFPLLYLADRRGRGWVNLAVLLGLLALSFASGPRFAFYGYVFFVGLAGGPFFERVIRRNEGRRGSRLLWLAIFLALTATIFTGGSLNFLSLLIQTLAASFVVFSAVFMESGSLPLRIMDHRFFQKLGTISYSFYLFHFAIFYWVARLLFRFLEPETVAANPFLFDVAVAAVTFCATFGVATLSYRFVGAPMIAWSKKLASRRRRLASAGSPA